MGRYCRLFVVAMSAAFTLLAFVQIAAADSDGTYTYTVGSVAATITSYSGPGGDVSIPATLGGEPVVAIGPQTFYDRGDITSVGVPQHVSSIGSYAFTGCLSLSTVALPQGVTSIGDWAFEDCPNLRNITLPEGLTSIGTGAFLECSSLSTMTIPSTVRSIGGQAFRDCESLQTVTIPDGVTSVAGYAFYQCSRLSAVTIPQSVTSIGDAAFCDCGGLSTITIPDRVTSIGSQAFEACGSLSHVTIPRSVTYIDDLAFSFCGSLSSVVFTGDAPSFGAFPLQSDPPDLTVYFIQGNQGFAAPPGPWMGYRTSYCDAAGIPITHTLTYIAGTGGSITGMTSQSLSYAFDGTAVTAVAATGYHFTGWSDGVSSATRTETDVTADNTVTATFAPDTQTLSTTTKLRGSSSGKLRRAYKLTGTVSPAGPGRVTITLTRLVGRRYRPAGKATLTVSGGKFAYSFKPKYSGGWHVVAKYSGGADLNIYLGSTSRTKVVKVD